MTRARGVMALPGAAAGAILSCFHPLQEIPPVPKRKPPSQRPERQLDDTARAIQRMAQEARAAKDPEETKEVKPKSRPSIGPVGKITDRPKPGGPVVSPSTKRPKMGGGA
ncbi:hypothetical protein TA3x_004105 [Tundrisphaera sp. TA3]|uniref:hypothetical protein n=1 Tax=Tundrisphaera sp. TA3 TaxID=3435775 RepID=UPI003EBD5C7A